MAVQRYRVPHLRELLDGVHAEMVQRLLTEYDRKQREHGPGRLWIRSISPVSRPGDAERPHTYVSREELEATQRSLEQDPGQFSRESLFSLATSFANVFRRMKWTVHYSTEGSPFITSDCPVLLRHEREDIKDAGIIRRDTHIEFPLSRTSLLSMTHDFALIDRLSGLTPNRETRRILDRLPEIRVSQATEESVREFNLHQARYCSRWAFCGRQDERLIEILQESSRNVRQRILSDGDFIRFDALTG
jgi:hypothetical protein